MLIKKFVNLNHMRKYTTVKDCIQRDYMIKPTRS